MDTEKVKEDLKERETSPEIEKQASDIEMSEKSTNEKAKNLRDDISITKTRDDETVPIKAPVKDIEDSKENNDSDENKFSKDSSPASKDFSEVSTSSEQIKTKRAKSKAKTNGSSRISMEKSEESSDEDSSKRQKMSETQPDSEIAECSGSKSDFSFRKLKSKVKKRYYRNRSNVEEEEESGETSTVHQADADGEDKSKSDSDADNLSLDPDGVDEQPTRERSSNHPERNSSPKFDARGADDSNEWTTASEEEVDIATSILQKEKPKPKWFMTQELVNRQIGNNPQFSGRFYGSLQAVQRLELMRKLNEHQGCVNNLSFNQKGNLLASASDDLTVKIWDWAVGKRQFSFQSGHKSNVFHVKWMPLDTESLMVTCARDGQVRLLELPIGKSHKIASHQGPIHKLAIHRETPHVVLSCGEDGKILSIDIREARPRKLLVIKEEMQQVQLYTIHSNPLNSNEFCVGGRTQAVRVYDRRKISTPLHKLCPTHLTENKHAHVTSIVYNYNGTEILASYNDEDIYLFDTLFPHPAGDFAHRYQGHRNNATVKGVNFFGLKSEYVVSGSDCGNIFIWDKDTECIVQWMPGDEQGVVNCLEPHPFIPVLATCGLDYDVKVWVPSSKKPPIMKNLDSCITSNIRNRAEELEDEPDAFDGQMLWILLRRIRQSERMRHSNRAFRRTSNVDRDLGDEDVIESSSEHNSSNNSDSFSDDDNERRFQCSPS